jgi:hypothetical protein
MDQVFLYWFQGFVVFPKRENMDKMMALVATQRKTKTIPAGFCWRVCARGSSLNTGWDFSKEGSSCYGR